MDKYKLKFTVLQLEIFRLLCVRAGTSLNQREIASVLSVSPTAVSKALPGLERNALISWRKGRLMNEVSLARTPEVLRKKQVENLRCIDDSGLVGVLEESCPGATIILFGSYARGEDTVRSDVDIAVVGAEACSADLSGVSAFLEREVRVNVYPSFDIAEELRANILSGIILSGGVRL